VYGRTLTYIAIMVKHQSYMDESTGKKNIK
jgi:hypothetical protein